MIQRVVIACLSLVGIGVGAESLPAQFSLRSVAGENFVSSVKNQSGGTCWTHATMAAMESNLMLTGGWEQSGESGEADLAEYHLDWWNGFNNHFNFDLAPKKGGLTVHQGGDFRVAAAYLSRGAGAVRNRDGQSYSSPPKENSEDFKYYYPRHIEWFSVGDDLLKINAIKEAIRNHGAMGTALAWSTSLYSSSKNSFYQPKNHSEEANHAVTIVGWDDSKVTQAPKPGAWLIKNSWGSGWGDGGYFWISYFDKVAGLHPEMGAVSFREVERFGYDRVYSHDYHGWRDTKRDAVDAFNSFEARGFPNGRELLKAVSFYTAAADVEFSIRVYRLFENGELKNLSSMQDGYFSHAGFHTVDLNWPVQLRAGEPFYVAIALSKGGQAFDRTSDVPVLLGAKSRVTVESRASAGESYFLGPKGWTDLQEVNPTANFSIKALTVEE